MTVVPYKDTQEGKKEQVAKMFNNIAHKYDLLNHVLSAGIDIYWRKKAIRMLRPYQPKHILDIATGTGDFAIEALSLAPDNIIGVDISAGMLEVGKEKIKKMNLEHIISLELGDSEKLRFEDNSFDAVIVSFGVRNFENLQKGLEDTYRVLRKGGVLVVLELSKPETFPFKQLYNLYFEYILPLVGNNVSKDGAAYTYLYESVKAFPYGKDFINILHNIGFTQTKCVPLTFGISSIYMGVKP